MGPTGNCSTVMNQPRSSVGMGFSTLLFSGLNPGKVCTKSLSKNGGKCLMTEKFLLGDIIDRL